MAIRDVQDLVSITFVLEVALTKEKVCNTETSKGSNSAIYLCHQMCSQGHADKAC